MNVVQIFEKTFETPKIIPKSAPKSTKVPRKGSKPIITITSVTPSTADTTISTIPPQIHVTPAVSTTAAPISTPVDVPEIFSPEGISYMHSKLKNINEKIQEAQKKVDNGENDFQTTINAYTKLKNQCEEALSKND